MERRRFAVLLAGAAAFVSLYAPQSLLPLLRGWMGTNAALAGLVISATTTGVAIAAPIAGWLADRLGRRRVIVAALFAAVAPTLLVAAAQSPSQLIAARFLEGLALPGIFTVTIAYIGYEWPVHESRAVTALYVAGTIGGGYCGRLVAGVVAEIGGWRIAFLALALTQLAIALWIRAWLAPERSTSRSDGGMRTNPLLLLRNPRLRGAYASGSVILFALVGGFTYVTLRLADAPFHLGPASLSAIFTVYIASMAITPIAGRLLNSLGHARMLMWMWATAVGGLLLTLPSNLPAIIIGLCVYSTGLFFAQTAVTSFVAESAPDARGAAVGLYGTFYYFGGSIGGVLPALAWTHAGWPGVVAMICAAALISAAIAWRVLRPSPVPPAPRSEPEARK